MSTPDHYQLRQWDPVTLLAAVAGVTRSAAVGSLLGGTLRRALGIAGRHADIVSVFPSVASGKIGWPGWAEGSTSERTAQQTAWARAGAESAGRSPEAFELSTQICFTAVAGDPDPLQQSVAKATVRPLTGQ